MFTGRRSFTKSSLFEAHFSFLTADSSVPQQLIIYFHPLLLGHSFSYLFRFWVLGLVWLEIS